MLVPFIIAVLIHGLINTGLTLIRGTTAAGNVMVVWWRRSMALVCNQAEIYRSERFHGSRLIGQLIVNLRSWAGNRDFIDFYRQDVGVPYETIQNGNRANYLS